MKRLRKHLLDGKEISVTMDDGTALRYKWENERFWMYHKFSGWIKSSHENHFQAAVNLWLKNPTLKLHRNKV